MVILHPSDVRRARDWNNDEARKGDVAVPLCGFEGSLRRIRMGRPPSPGYSVPVASSSWIENRSLSRVLSSGHGRGCDKLKRNTSVSNETVRGTSEAYSSAVFMRVRCSCRTRLRARRPKARLRRDAAIAAEMLMNTVD